MWQCRYNVTHNMLYDFLAGLRLSVCLNTSMNLAALLLVTKPVPPHLALDVCCLHDTVEGHVICRQVCAHQVLDAVLGTGGVTGPVAQQHCTAVAAEQAVGDQHAAVLACTHAGHTAQQQQGQHMQ